MIPHNRWYDRNLMVLKLVLQCATGRVQGRRRNQEDFEIICLDDPEDVDLHTTLVGRIGMVACSTNLSL